MTRPACDVCGDFTDDDGPCGSCVNCRMPLCTHRDDPEGDGIDCPDVCCSFRDPVTGEHCDRERGHENWTSRVTSDHFTR